ncbi:MAG: amino acid adenylation domain-containing protein [Betaproteobacteria bacterium]|nr:amino acid adenylation domain-containing protein [Betaproteobacteria bacterium]
MPGSGPASRAGREGREALWEAVRSVLQSQRAAPPLEPMSRDATLPASFAQQRLWFLERLAPGSPIHNQTVACRLSGSLSVRDLERSLSGMLERHEVLRTTLRTVDGQLVQRIHAPPAFTLPVVDLGMLEPALREDEAKRQAEHEAQEPFDLDRVPLLRARLFRLTPREHLLVLTMHHLAFDGWSFDVFMRELCALYGAFLAGAPSPLPGLSLQYADVAAWQRRWLEGDSRKPLLDYWTTQMRGPRTVLRLPSNCPRNPARTRRGACRSLALSQELTDALKRLGAREGATPFMTFLAGFQALLHRYTGVEDVIVGTPVANRNRAEIENLVGLFANTLALRTSLAGQPDFRELLARVRRTVLGAYAHQDLPFEMLVEALGEPQRTHASPLFEVMFAYQNLPRSAWPFPDLEVDAWNIGNGTAKFDVTLFMLESGSGLSTLLEYDADLFDAAAMARLLEHFRALLEGIVRDPGESIATVPLMSVAETRQVLQEWNDTTVDYPRDMAIPRVFEARAQRSPDATALVFPGGEITYAQLDRHANRLARYLEAVGVVPGARVGVCIESSPSLIVALLAILKAGAAYVPVEPSSPAERVAGILQRAAVGMVVTDGSLERGASGPGVRVIHLAREREAIDSGSPEAPAVEIAASSLACVMATSGSTGSPKGVGITHRGVVRLVKAANYAELGPREVLLQLAPVSFDASTFEIWGALLNGARLVLPPAGKPSLQEIARMIRRHRVSVLWLTAGLFELMVESHLADLAGVRQLLSGGEVLSVAHAELFLQRAEGCRLINCYGPTENTTFTTFHPVERGHRAGDGPIPIGRPVSNTQVYVLDPLRQPVPIGVAGEAFIGGDGLMQGYVGDADSTGERLIPNPFPDRPGAYLYRSGDIVRYRRDGSLEFLGRTDDQVKIRGFRVEPGEVEAVLCRSPLVKRATVVARQRSPGGKCLVAYLVPATDEAAPDDLFRSIRDFLRARLPESHVPSAFVALESIPLTDSGKVDREALPPPGAAPVARTNVAALPRDEVERAVADAFAQVLAVGSIGLDDDFFDHGGTSLAALRLVATLEDAFLTSLPLVSLYEHPTVAGMAAQLRNCEKSALQLPRSPIGGESNLVEIKRSQAGTPLFLVPGGHGGMAEMTLYAQLMRHLKREQPVFGLLAHGLDGRTQPHASVTEMAEAYVRTVRGMQPRGPYALGGECVGGVVAFEMARQLLAQGQAIALLLLMDTWCPSFAGGAHYRYIEAPRTLLRARKAVARDGAADLRRVLHDHIRDRPPFGPLRSLRYGVNVARTLKRVADPWLAAVERVGKPAPGTERIAGAESNYVDLAMRYRPQPYDGRVTLLVSSANHRQGLAEGWRRFAAGGLAVHSIPGDHDSYIRDTPEATARLMQACLDEALPGG